MRILFVLSLSLFFVACSPQYANSLYNQGLSGIGLKNTYQIKRHAHWILARDANIAIATQSKLDPVDFSRTNRLFHATASRAFKEQFAHASMLVSSDASNLALANEAYAKRCELLFIAELSRVENNLDSRFELSGGTFQNPERKVAQDRLVVQILIYESLTGVLLDQILLDTRAAYFKHDNQAPMHLIEESLYRAAEQLAAY